MKEYQTADIRNLSIVGHASSGKTMLAEAMLACAGDINRMGSIDAGNTQSDYSPDEKERKISISASLLRCHWLDKKFNLIDCPGYMDFISEALSALRVSDCAVIVINAAHGIGVGTDQVWKAASQQGLHKIVVVNGLDKEHVNFESTLAAIRARYGDRVFPMDLPVNAGPGFNQTLDVMRSELITYAGDGSGKFTEAPAPDDFKERTAKLHQQLIEFVAESDDALMEKFFDQGGLSEEEWRAGVHKAFLEQSFIPLFCTAAETNVGVARLMDFIAKYGVAPTDRAETPARDGDDQETTVKLAGPDPVLFVFKTSSEGQAGDLSFFRIYSGSLHQGMDLHNSERNADERIGQIYSVNGKNRDALSNIHAGDIGAVVKLKDTHTNNTLCHPKKPITLPAVDYPKPNIHQALHPRAKGEEDKIASGLAALHNEDPSFLYHSDPELHQTVISGQGDLHLQVVGEKLRRRYKVTFDLMEPKVPYRETIKGRGESKYRHKKQTGGAGQFAEVWMRIEPRERDSGIEFTQSLVGQNVDRVFVPSVEKGINVACKEGILAGYRVVDLKIDFYDGKMHPVDSKDVAFQIAGKEGFREAFLAARPCILEPVLQVEIHVPEEDMGTVIGDLSSRRGKVLGMDSEDGMSVVKAHAPQKELYKYATVLRSLTSGRGYHKEEFSHYEEMPREMESKVVAEAKAAKQQQQHS